MYLLQVYGDLTFMLTSYFFFIFNIVDVEVNFFMGYTPIGIIGLYISITLLSIVFGILGDLKNRLKVYRINMA